MGAVWCAPVLGLDRCSIGAFTGIRFKPWCVRFRTGGCHTPGELERSRRSVGVAWCGGIYSLDPAEAQEGKRFVVRTAADFISSDAAHLTGALWLARVFGRSTSCGVSPQCTPSHSRVDRLCACRVRVHCYHPGRTYLPAARARSRAIP